MCLSSAEVSIGLWFATILLTVFPCGGNWTILCSDVILTRWVNMWDYVYIIIAYIIRTIG